MQPCNTVVKTFGGVSAYETRQVHIEELNDSRNIGISIYNTIILSGFGVLASFAIKADVSMQYLLMSSIKIFCVAITVCIIFLPKIRQLRKDPDGVNFNVTRRLTSPSVHSRVTTGKNPMKENLAVMEIEDKVSKSEANSVVSCNYKKVAKVCFEETSEKLPPAEGEADNQVPISQSSSSD